VAAAGAAGDVAALQHPGSNSTGRGDLPPPEEGRAAVVGPALGAWACSISPTASMNCLRAYGFPQNRSNAIQVARQLAAATRQTDHTMRPACDAERRRLNGAQCGNPARIAGRGERTVWLCAHLDTVPEPEDGRSAIEAAGRDHGDDARQHRREDDGEHRAHRGRPERRHELSSPCAAACSARCAPRRSAPARLRARRRRRRRPRNPPRDRVAPARSSQARRRSTCASTAGPQPAVVRAVARPARSPCPRRAAFTCARDGVEQAVVAARTAAGDRHVVVAGGASADRSRLQVGLVDEMQLHVAPALLGGGIALYASIDARRLELASTRTVQTAAATHLRFAVRRR
jgi:hypothetical protein